MKRKYATIVFTLICILGLSVAAKAQTRGQIVETQPFGDWVVGGGDQIVVTLPFEFVVSGKTLPAGKYKVIRVSVDKSDGLILSSYENRTSVIVHPIEIESTRPHKPNVSFERVGEQHFLSTIETTHNIYTISVSRSAIMEATQRSHDGAPVSGSSRSN
jgi:hypothetical protein